MKRSIVLGLAVTTLAAAAPNAQAAFPGKNGLIGFSRVSLPPKSPFGINLFTMAADGTAQTRVVRGRKVVDEISFSPDGKLITYAGDRGENTPVEIYVANADGSGERRVTKLRSFSFAPSFSPDGQTIVFSSEASSPKPKGDRPPKAQVHTIRLDGTGLKVLRTPRAGVDPMFSPDGTTIALSLTRDLRDNDFDSRLAIMAANGSGLRTLTAANGPGGPAEVNPDWAPDGSRLLFEEIKGGTRKGKSAIATIKPDGTGVTFLTRTRSYDTNPIFSPDGTRIVFTSDRDNRSMSKERLSPAFEVYTMAVDGTDVRRLTTNRRPDVFPAWQPLP